MSIKGKQIVVVGGSSGIGLATARLALDEGAEVTIAARHTAGLAGARKTLGNIRTRVADITDAASLAAAFADIEVVDHLFISAGTVAGGPVLSTPVEALRKPLEERVIGALNVIKAVAPKMSAGSVTLVSGLFVERPAAGAALMIAALAGVEALGRTLSLELAPIRFNVVSPGWIDTPLHDAWGEQRKAVLEQQAARHPGKRVGRGDEVASAVIALMKNQFINGEVLHVDGGLRNV